MRVPATFIHSSSTHVISRVRSNSNIFNIQDRSVANQASDVVVSPSSLVSAQWKNFEACPAHGMNPSVVVTCTGIQECIARASNLLGRVSGWDATIPRFDFRRKCKAHSSRRAAPIGVRVRVRQPNPKPRVTLNPSIFVLSKSASHQGLKLPCQRMNEWGMNVSEYHNSLTPFQPQATFTPQSITPFHRKATFTPQQFTPKTAKRGLVSFRYRTQALHVIRPSLSLLNHRMNCWRRFASVHGGVAEIEDTWM